MKPYKQLLIALLVAFISASSAAYACTGIALKAKNDAVVFGRTWEWGAFDTKSRLVIIPHGQESVGLTPDGRPGMKWKSKYGVVGIVSLEKEHLVDGLNQKGLAVGALALFNFSEYQKYDPHKSEKSLGPLEVVDYLLTQFSSVEEVRDGLAKIRVVAVQEPSVGFVPGSHWFVTDPSGKAIVVEYHKGELKIFDAPLGVITNSPTYDWHITNLRNYINLSPLGLQGKRILGLEFRPLGGGSGLIGLPGDFTSPSRFVRAVAFKQAARPTKDGDETVYEVFRILDNFNIPIVQAESDIPTPKSYTTASLRSGTQWTSAADTKNLVYYNHTQHNRRIRKVNLNRIDFRSFSRITYLPLDKEKNQDFEDITVEKE